MPIHIVFNIQWLLKLAIANWQFVFHPARKQIVMGRRGLGSPNLRFRNQAGAQWG